MSTEDHSLYAAIPIVIGGALIFAGLAERRLSLLWRRRAELAGRMLVSLALLFLTLESMTRSLADGSAGGVAVGLAMIVLAALIASPLYDQNYEEKTK